MHNAPSVRYPMERSPRVAVVLASIWLAGMAACAVWSIGVGGLGWRQWVVIVSLLACAALAFAQWRALPTGTLRWDGQLWWWATTGAETAVELSLRLDLQHGMLLLVRELSGNSRAWCYAERASRPQYWNDLRRAVVAPVRTPALPAGVSAPT